MRYALITSHAASLINFRGHLIKKIISEGHEVFALACDFDESTRIKIRSLGALPIDCDLNRTGLNPFVDLLATFRLVVLLRKLNLDTILTYAIKPVIFGGISAFLANIPIRVAMIEGLGFAYTNDGKEFSLKKNVLKFIVNNLYKISLKFQNKVIFLNQDDIDEFILMKLVSPSKVIKLGGIGVDLKEWKQKKTFKHPITFTIVARLLKEKGILEFIEAARTVKEKYPKTNFLVLGETDLNPSSLSRDLIQEWVNQGLIEWPGQVDVKKWHRKTSVFVLPSYREGVPRSTQEALAMGLPVITTNVPGCRDTVLDGINGFLVEPRNSKSLADAMIMFIKSPDLIKIMGHESRSIAVKNFDVTKASTIIYTVMQGKFVRK
jgi:glycosyltransferase involved in cell wall biosynthesis